MTGSEKVVVPQEKMIENKIIIFMRKEQSTSILSSEIRSINYKNPSYIQTVVIKYKKNNILTIVIPQLRDELPVIILLRALGMVNDKEISNYVTLGKHDPDMVRKLQPSLDAIFKKKDTTKKKDINNPTNKIMTQKEAQEEVLEYIRKSFKSTDEDIEHQKMLYLTKFLEEDLLPHVKDNPMPRMNKAKFICLMINKLLTRVLERKPIDDRDSYINKRVDLTGPLLNKVFSKAVEKLVRECGKSFRKKVGTDMSLLREKKAPSIIGNIKANIVEKEIKTSLLTGRWPMTNTQIRKGVSQVKNNLSFLVSLALLNKIKSPTGDTTSASKMVAPRQLHNTSVGYLCPVETPEGQKVGLDKFLSVTSTLTVCLTSQEDKILDILKEKGDEFGFKWLYEASLDQYSQYRVFLNGNWLGLITKGSKFTDYLRKEKLAGILDKTIGIVNDFNNLEIKINSDGGRYIRPLLVVDSKTNKLKITEKELDEIRAKFTNPTKDIKWDDVLKEYPHAIEYVDIEESQYCLIATTQNDLKNNLIRKKHKLEQTGYTTNNYLNVYGNYTHCEINPALIFGITASTIPFIDRNPGIRALYDCAHTKQGIGVFASNYKERLNTTLAYVSYYAERPLISTRLLNYTRVHNLPAGNNVILAIASYTGYNQEDSIIMNQSAIDRGLFRCSFYRKYEDTVKKNQATGKVDIFTKPNKNKVSGMKNANYDKLNEEGYVPEGTPVESGDILFGKITPRIQKSAKDNLYEDNSTSIKQYEHGVVAKVIPDLHDNDDYHMMKMMVRTERIPKIGDKFVSKYAQKGTIGLTLRQEDMPFTAEGIIPDIIINPHAIPSRLTVGQLIENIAGKIAAIDAVEIDGTPMNKINVTQLRERLAKLGYSDDGTEVLYNGLTGHKFKAKIFIGPNYYLRLKHMVDDKVHARAIGPTVMLTRQPAEGRSRDGGLRIGEMERDAILAHGSAFFQQERTMKCSDGYSVHVCKTCGYFAQKARESTAYKCIICNTYSNITEIEVPYAFKLFLQEIISLSVFPKIRIKDKLY